MSAQPILILLCWLFMLAVALPGNAGVTSEQAQNAHKLAAQSMIVDTHIDVPYRLEENWEDVTKPTAKGDFDYERAKKGGLNIPFMSIYTPAESEALGTSFQLANTLIDSVEALVGRAPDKFMLVRSTSDARIAMKKGMIGLAMGMENGSPIAGKLENLAFFHDRGISYITLTHGLSNHIADSSYDTNHQWNGLSPFGKEVVVEMNRLGIMIDISHVSDEAFYQAIEISRTPVIASHSSARQFTPGWERNMSDDMIRALAAKGGVIQINFGSSFLTGQANQWYAEFDAAREAYLTENGFDKESEESKAYADTYREQHPFPYATLDDLAAHFRHVIELVGVEHVGIGSDFDGVGDSLPVDMKDVSYYPKLIEEFLRLEYSTQDIQAILGGNLLRVWKAAEDYAMEQKQS